jgi:hypothetical protein
MPLAKFKETMSHKAKCLCKVKDTFRFIMMQLTALNPHLIQDQNNVTY